MRGKCEFKGMNFSEDGVLKNATSDEIVTKDAGDVLNKGFEDIVEKKYDPQDPNRPVPGELRRKLGYATVGTLAFPGVGTYVGWKMAKSRNRDLRSDRNMHEKLDKIQSSLEANKKTTNNNPKTPKTKTGVEKE